MKAIPVLFGILLVVVAFNLTTAPAVEPVVAVQPAPVVPDDDAGKCPINADDCSTCPDNPANGGDCDKADKAERSSAGRAVAAPMKLAGRAVRAPVRLLRGIFGRRR